MRKIFTHPRARTGSAVHALAQPTPLGDGPKGFLFVLNDALIIAEKACTSHQDVCNVES